MKNLRCLHFGSYWMGKNDVVYSMVTDLKRMCTTKEVDLEIYNSSAKKVYQDDLSNNKTYPVRWLRQEFVLSVVNSFKPDVIICNAGGISLTKESFEIVKKRHIITVGISLSDPDVFEDQSKTYFHDFDLFYTNSLHSLEHHYASTPHIHILPFAASENIHKPVKTKKIYDIVVVGHARKERLELVETLKKSFRVGTFGNGWGEGSLEVQGENQVKAINQGKIYLSFPQTTAGFINVKVGVFEAAACKSCIVLPYFPEIERYFTYGVDILGYSNHTQLFETLSLYLKNERLRSWIAENAYTRFLSEHTWINRWEMVLNHVKEYRSERF